MQEFHDALKALDAMLSRTKSRNAPAMQLYELKMPLQLSAAAIDEFRMNYTPTSYSGRIGEIPRSILMLSAILTFCLINLRDVLMGLDRLDARVTERNGFIGVATGNIDLTDLIKHARDTACHSHSGRSKIGKSGIHRWNFYPPGLGDNVSGLRNESTNDILVTFATVPLYIEANVVLAIRLASETITKLAGQIDTAPNIRRV